MAVVVPMSISGVPVKMFKAVAVLTVVAGVAAGCGSDNRSTTSDSATGKPTPVERKAAVGLTVLAPAGATVVRTSRVEVRGTVTPPSATVRVRGDLVTVKDGVFSAPVPLSRGPNDIDIAASASDRAPATTSLSVTRGRSHAEIAAAARRAKAARAERAAERLAAKRARAAARAAEQARKTADNYPADIRANFMDVCVIDGTKSACECALEKLESRYSLKQFIAVDALASQTGEIPAAFSRVFASCA
jgi:hypothetical protein